MDPASQIVVMALRAAGTSEDALQKAIKDAEGGEKSVRSVLIDEQIVTEFELANAIASFYGVQTGDVSTMAIDVNAMKLLALPLARRHQMVPIIINSTSVTVALVDPGNVLALDDIRAATGLQVDPVVVTDSDMTKLLDRYSRSTTDLDEAAAALAAEEEEADADDISVDDDAPVVRYVSSLLERAITARGSDIHVEPGEKELRVRLRIDGVLHEIDTVPRQIQSALLSRLKIMSGLDITERRVPQNGRITMDLGGRHVDLRTATLPTVWGEKIVLRILDTGGIDLDLKKLGFSENNYNRFARSFRKPHGMVLVTGPTGSGKSTTLYATLGEIARPEVNVITVEDPVEYRIGGIAQVQVNIKAGLTFAAVLPAILRSDPDVVLVGEIRDQNTAQLAIEAALTGHLVLSTLHTNSAPAAVTRLVEMGVEPFLVGSSVDAVLAQRLVRRLCEWCKEEFQPNPEELSRAGWPNDLPVPPVMYRAVGCRSCSTTGFRGRLAVNEVMTVSEEIERLTVVNAPASDIAKVAREEGMTTLREDGMAKAAQGLTTIEEVLRVTV